MKFKHVMGLALAAALLPFSVNAAEVEWRLNVDYVQARPQAKLAAQFAERINEKSTGRMKVTPYFGGALGFAQTDSLRSVRAGSVEMSTMYASYLNRDAPDLASAFPQGVAFSPDEVIKVRDTLSKIQDKYLETWKVRRVGYLEDPIYNIYVFCKEPVDSIATLKGKKMRVWARDQVVSWEKLGVAAQVVPQTELYLALQTGVVDCALYPPGIAKTISLQEVTKYASFVHTVSSPLSVIIVNDAKYASLPADLKAVVDEAGQWVSAESAKRLVDMSDEENAIKELTDSGKVKFLPPFSKADQMALNKAANDVWAVTAAEIKRNAPAYREQMMKAIADAQARKQ